MISGINAAFLTSTKQGPDMCLAQGHILTQGLVRLEPASPRSSVKHPTTDQATITIKLAVLARAGTIRLSLYTICIAIQAM